jgi:hypothetical protein
MEKCVKKVKYDVVSNPPIHKSNLSDVNSDHVIQKYDKFVLYYGLAVL